MFVGAALGSAFFLLAPPLNYRFWGHYSLSNQWLLVAALYVFARAQQASPGAVRRFVISAAVLAAISVGINPYLAFEVLLVLIAGVASLLWQKRSRWRSPPELRRMLASGRLRCRVLFGPGHQRRQRLRQRRISRSVDEPAGPVRSAHLHLAHLPSTARARASASTRATTILARACSSLLAIVVIAALMHRKASCRQPDKRWLVPLALCCLLLTLLALSTKITLGATNADRPRSAAALFDLFAPLRATRASVLGAVLRDPGGDSGCAVSRLRRDLGESC